MDRAHRGRTPLAIVLGLTLCLACTALGNGRPNASAGSGPTSPTAPMTVAPITPSSSPAAPAASSPSPTPIPSGPDIEAGAMLDASDGWAVTGDRLWITADAGRTWRDATPPGGLGTGGFQRFLGASFVDPQHGWV